MSMLRHRAAHASTVETHALISVRTEVDALYRDELLALQPRDGLDVRWTYTRAATPPPGGWTGRVDGDMLAAIGPPVAAAPHVFVCGPTGFVEHVATLVVDAGHDPLRVRTERFGPT
jgi:ferredoxin-NADP reductase